jgi:lipoate-protein ligase A
VEELTCRLLPFTATDGATNMATDEVLLESAAAGLATLRFYAWEPPTLSLGYFQPAQVRLAEPRWAQLPWVRRPSGGDTLVHDREVTYALALPPGSLWQGKQPWPLRMHQVIAAALATFGVVAELYGPLRPTPFNGPLCFHHYTPGDLLVAGAKVVGSAQRKHRGAFLQHGGLLCRSSTFTPTLPGIAELTGVDLTPAQLCAAITDCLHAATGWQLVQGQLTLAEVETVARLVRDKYATDRWNHKR